MGTLVNSRKDSVHDEPIKHNAYLHKLISASQKYEDLGI